MDRIFDASLAPSTWRTYGVAQSDFASFCNSIHTPPIPASEDLLIFYIAHLSLRLAHSSIRTYMSAIRNWHIVHGYSDPLTGKPKLGLFLRGVKKLKPAARDARLPITPFVLDKIRQVLLAHPSDYTNIMFWAACCLGFFGFLRSGEFTLPASASFDSTIHLTPQDIAVDSLDNTSKVFITIKASKTDISRQGLTICVGTTNTPICPVTAILTYLAVRGIQSGPLFCLPNSQPLTQAKFAALLKHSLAAAGIDCTRYSGHSFRIGAATTAAARGIPDSTIQTLGRWASDCFRRYIRLPPEELAGVSQTLVQVSSNSHSH